jgi:hypothetical protein
MYFVGQSRGDEGWVRMRCRAVRCAFFWEGGKAWNTAWLRERVGKRVKWGKAGRVTCLCDRWGRGWWSAGWGC